MVKMGPKITSKNNLAINFPEMAKMWDYEKNHPMKPNQIKYNCSKKYYWICLVNKKHRTNNACHPWEFKRSIWQMNNRKLRCPFCTSGHQAVIREESLGGMFPELEKEWDYEKNDKINKSLGLIKYKINPFNVRPTMRKPYVHWVCPICKNQNGTKPWLAPVQSRTRPTFCRWCEPISTSLTELRIAFETKHLIDFDIKDDKVEKTKRGPGKPLWSVDIKIPRLKIVIEYDGEHTHKTKESINTDKVKVRDLERGGWKVIRIREHPLEKISDHDILIRNLKIESSDKGLKKCVERVFKRIEEVSGTTINGLDDYLQKEEPQHDKNEMVEYYNSLEKRRPEGKKGFFNKKQRNEKGQFS